MYARNPAPIHLLPTPQTRYDSSSLTSRASLSSRDAPGLGLTTAHVLTPLGSAVAMCDLNDSAERACALIYEIAPGPRPCVQGLRAREERLQGPPSRQGGRDRAITRL